MVKIHQMAKYQENIDGSEALLEGDILSAYCRSADMAWVVTTTGGVIIKSNDNFCKKTGYTHNELAGKSIKTVIPESGQKDIDQILSDNFPDSINGKRAFLKKDGTQVNFSCNTTLINKSSGKTYRVWYINNLEIASEMSELRQHRFLLKALMEYTPDGIYFKDLQSRFLLVSLSKFRTSGIHDSGELRGKSDFDLFTTEHAQKAYDEEQEIIKTGKPLIGVEEKETWLNGAVTWASTSKMPYYDEDGKIIGTFGISRDITDKKKFEIEVVEKSRILQGIVRHLPVIIFKTDEEGGFTLLQGTDSRIEKFRQSRTAKLSINHALQLACKKLKQQSVKEDYFSFTSNCVSEGSNWHFENFLFKEVEEAAFAGFSIDITERKQAEQDLKRHSKNLQKINKELDQFAYVVSHDLKAPLRAINNLSEWIEEDLGDHTNEDLKNNLQLLRGRVLRMQSLIDGILEYSRIGRLHVQTENIDTDRLVLDLIANLAIPDHFIVVKRTRLPVIMANKVRLEQVFMNLISNAVKYHDKPEGIVEIDYQYVDGSHQFSVQDDGPGIAPEFHEKVFMIFQTLQSRDMLESTGVGLSIVKKIIEEHGGKVWIESEQGEGAKFIFTLSDHHEHNYGLYGG